VALATPFTIIINMIELDNMEWDNFAIVKQKFINEIIQDLEGLEFPPEWRPKDVLGFIIKKIEEKGKKI